MKLPLTYDNYIFDLYGTLVDIHTDESDTAIWEKLAMFYGYYGALYEAKELKARYETLVKSSEAELKKKLEDMDIEKQNEASDAQFAISYAHEASPEIHIEDVFEKLYEEKGVNPTKELSVHTGQFFRVMSTLASINLLSVYRIINKQHNMWQLNSCILSYFHSRRYT